MIYSTVVFIISISDEFDIESFSFFKVWVLTVDN